MGSFFSFASDGAPTTGNPSPQTSCVVLKALHTVVPVNRGQRLKTVHFVRHGHGTHNAVGELDYENYKLEEHADAQLTSLGIQQCISLSSEAHEAVRRADCVVVSPMRRTLETAKHAFLPGLRRVPWIASELVREQSGLHPCDRRLPISALSQDHAHVDFSHIISDADPLYPLYPTSREPSESVIQRCKAFLAWLSHAPYCELVVVTHSAFLRHMLPLLGQADEHFLNCEMRSFALVVDGAQAEAFAAQAELKMRVEAPPVEAPPVEAPPVEGAGGGQGAGQGAAGQGAAEGDASGPL